MCSFVGPNMLGSVVNGDTEKTTILQVKIIYNYACEVSISVVKCSWVNCGRVKRSVAVR